MHKPETGTRPHRHPGTRNNLASAYRTAGRLTEAIPLFVQNLAEQERVLGPDHPDTLTTRQIVAALGDEAK